MKRSTFVYLTIILLVAMLCGYGAESLGFGALFFILTSMIVLNLIVINLCKKWILVVCVLIGTMCYFGASLRYGLHGNLKDNFHNVIFMLTVGMSVAIGLISYFFCFVLVLIEKSNKKAKVNEFQNNTKK